MDTHTAYWVYLLPLLLLWVTWGFCRRRRERVARSVWRESMAAGITEPDSLHPWIDSERCLGCGSCVTACPEGEVLGIIGGQARIVDASHCIGHGACRSACPTDAIELVLGTAEQGVEIPTLGPDFQTDVPGVFVAGELSGMGLIRNAIEQGSQAMAAAADFPGVGTNAMPLDVVVVGAGPAGLSASLAAKERGLRAITLEQECFGGTVAHYPRGKIVMTAPATLPLVGEVRLRETSKEALLALWQGVLEETGLEIRECERVESVRRVEGGFTVETTRGRYQTHTVVLAVGRRGTPRKLGVAGEERSKVVYRLTDAEQYVGREVLVVGGGDSAVEAAMAVGEQPGSTVVLSYRGESFKRVKPGNRRRLEEATRAGQVRVLLQSRVEVIGESTVTLGVQGTNQQFANDAVIVCAGGVLPTAFLRAIGVSVETRYGTPLG